MTDTEVTDTATTVGNIVQLTETPSPPRRWIWHAEPLAEDVVTFGTLPDPRDARIKELEAQVEKFSDLLFAERKDHERAKDRVMELEAALRELYLHVAKHRPLSLQDVLIMHIIDAALMPEPEASMRETVEKLEV